MEKNVTCEHGDSTLFRSLLNYLGLRCHDKRAKLTISSPDIYLTLNGERHPVDAKSLEAVSTDNLSYLVSRELDVIAVKRQERWSILALNHKGYHYNLNGIKKVLPYSR